MGAKATKDQWAAYGKGIKEQVIKSNATKQSVENLSSSKKAQVTHADEFVLRVEVAVAAAVVALAMIVVPCARARVRVYAFCAAGATAAARESNESTIPDSGRS